MHWGNTVDKCRSQASQELDANKNTPKPGFTGPRRQEGDDEHRYQNLGAQQLLHHRLSLHSLRSGHTMSLEPKGGGLSFWEKLQAGYFVIFPQKSLFLPIWDSMIAALIVFCAWAVPYEVGFLMLSEPPQPAGNSGKKSGPDGMLGLHQTTTMINLLFAVDMVLQLIVSYSHPINRRWIRRPGKIIEAYLKGRFVIDLISVLPYEQLTYWLVLHFGEGYRFSGLLSLLMLLRMLRVSRMIERYESRLDIDYGFVNMISLVVTLCLTVHWGACFWGFILGVEWEFGVKVGDTWYDAMLANKPIFFQHGHTADPSADGGWSLYTASLYWSAMTVTSIGYGDITAMNRLEAAATTAFMLVGGVIWAHIIGNVCAIASSFSAGKAAYESQMDSLNEMMRSLHLNQGLKVELREYFMRRRLLYHREKQVELLRSMSPELQERVARSVQERVLKVWFFRGITDSGFLVGLVERFLYQVYPPRELIRLGHALCNLREGMALRGYRIQFPGDIWGEAELLLSNQALLEDVQPVPLSYLEVQYLTRDNLDGLTLHYPEQRRIIQKATAWMALQRAVTMKVVQPSWEEKVKQHPARRPSQAAGGVAELRRRTTVEDAALPALPTMGEGEGLGADAASSTKTSVRYLQEVREMRQRIIRMESTQEEVYRRVGSVEDKLGEAIGLLNSLKDQKGLSRSGKSKL